MSNRPRTREHFPRMKDRARSRRKRSQQRRVFRGIKLAVNKWQESVKTLNRATTRATKSFDWLSIHFSKEE